MTAVDGRAAADLRLLGAIPPRHRWMALLNPAPGARRLASAWRVGRLTSALPGPALDLVADVDRRLAGLKVVRLPIRDGQTPSVDQVRRLLHVVHTAPGRVFVHCGAGVGRTGSMAAAYLVQTGQQSATAAVRLNLAVGPPAIEQIYYGLNLTRTHAGPPPLAVVAVSRLVDAPRRMWSWL